MSVPRQRPPARSERPGRANTELASFRNERRKPRPQKPKEPPKIPPPSPEKGGFRVLVAVHRPRYRARTERAMRGFDWEVRSLLNKEDPVGMIQKQPPNIFVISDDFGRQKDLGILRAVQRFRDSGMKIVGVFEDAESAAENGSLCEVAIAPPWNTALMRATLAGIYTEVAGGTPDPADNESEDDDEA